MDGRWSAAQTPANTRRRLAANEIHAYRATLAQRRQEVDAAIARDWGVLARLVGQKFLYAKPDYPQFHYVQSFSWLNRGTSVAISYDLLATGQTASWIMVTRDTASGKFRALTHGKFRAIPFVGQRGDVSVTADGRVNFAWDPTPDTKDVVWGGGDGTLMLDYQLADDSLRYEYYYVGKNAKSSRRAASGIPSVTGKSNESLRTVVAEQQRQHHATMTRIWASIAADSAAKAAEAAANPKKGFGGGLLRAAIGAGLGVAAANANGMDASQTLGAAAKGVALMNPESQVAQVVGASGDAVLQSSGLGIAPAGTGSTGAGGGTGPAGFTKKTNLAVGSWCPGFTMQNYRTEALKKDANVQLRTMCGQAFEYYNMYENAIRQGYSEADCNRTYAAHEGATRNLKAFVAGSQ